jgi:peptide/nickel transport system permease protein
MSLVGLAILVFFVLLAFVGPLLYDYDHQEYGAGECWSPRRRRFSWARTIGTGRAGRAYPRCKDLSLRGSARHVHLHGDRHGCIGISSGYFGGRTRAFLKRVTDAFLVLPWLPLMLVLAALLGSSLWNIVVVIGVTSWAGTARLARAQTLSVKERQFVERARSIGAGHVYIMRKKILPNVLLPDLSNTVLVSAEPFTPRQP